MSYSKSYRIDPWISVEKIYADVQACMLKQKNFGNARPLLTLVSKAHKWSGTIIATSASPTTSTEKTAISPSSVVRSGQHDIKYRVRPMRVDAAGSIRGRGKFRSSARSRSRCVHTSILPQGRPPHEYQKPCTVHSTIKRHSWWTKGTSGILQQLFGGAFLVVIRKNARLVGCHGVMPKPEDGYFKPTNGWTSFTVITCKPPKKLGFDNRKHWPLNSANFVKKFWTVYEPHVHIKAKPGL